MNDLEERVKDLEDNRVKILEEKVKILEETLETLKNMNLSGQMGEYIQKRNQTLRMVDLLNSVSDQPALDFHKEEEQVRAIQARKNSLDQQIANAIAEADDFSDNYPDDSRYFDYEDETGIEIDFVRNIAKQLGELADCIGKGIRIVGYNGFDTEKIIIPKEISGKPVVSIGEKAFMNAEFSEIIISSSVKAILAEAFKGCKKLEHISLPEGLRYLGMNCFSDSGLKKFYCPETLKSLPIGCFYSCKQFKEFNGGHQIIKIGDSAFFNCISLTNFSIPDSVKEIDARCFAWTGINLLIIPPTVSQVAFDIFGSFKTNMNVVMVFLGKNTDIKISSLADRLNGVTMIYCLPGSTIQKYARKHNIPIKPLSEFNMENYNV